ncbi:MAG: pentapeptide repeat-containing protein [Haliscomenobacteraceae bacterium CHB4]|nr:pentapeptide repeat-containing protein [Haliscomenobacteraceae bacterium CHB4]
MALDKNKSNDSPTARIDVLSRIIIALIIGVVIGVAISQLGLETLRSQIQNLVFVFIWIVLITGLFAFWVVHNKERLLKRIFGVSNTELSDLNQTAQSFWYNVVEKDYDKAKRDLTLIFKRAMAWYSWMNFRRWVVMVFQSLLVGFGGLLGTLILYNQNKLLIQQNELLNQQNVRLDQQTYLQEAERRSSLISLMGSILDAINLELKEDVGAKGVRDISPQLIGRVIALSNSLRPYRYLGSDSLVGRELSPERGYLLLSIVSSEIDPVSLRRIYRSADFSYADLKKAVLSGEFLAGVNLDGADLEGALLDETDLSNAHLNNTELNGAVLARANMRSARLRDAKMVKAHLASADLSGTVLLGADLTRANLSFANLSYTSFNAANLSSANLDQAIFTNTNLQQAILDSARVSEFTWLDSLPRTGPDTLPGIHHLISNYYTDSVQTKLGWYYLLLRKEK